jgi:hypothetical protein
MFTTTSNFRSINKQFREKKGRDLVIALPMDIVIDVLEEKERSKDVILAHIYAMLFNLGLVETGEVNDGSSK